MLLYFCAIWLVSFYTSSGAPPPNLLAQEPTPNPRNASNQPISLSALAMSCENPFLSAHIKSKIPDCPELVNPSDEKQFQCMLFYDINSQLCSAVASSKLALNDKPEEYNEKIEASQDVSQLCNEARGWTYFNLGDEYTKNVKFIFNNIIRCSKTCSADYTNILNMESNFYCKYFKWGTEKLRPQAVKTLMDAQPQSGVVAGSSSVGKEAEKATIIDPKNILAKEELPAPIIPNPGTSIKDVPKEHNIVYSNGQPQNDNTVVSKVEAQQTVLDTKSTDKAISTTKSNTETQNKDTVAEIPINSETVPGADEKAVETANAEENKETSGNELSGEGHSNNIPPLKESDPEEIKKSETLTEAVKTEIKEEKTLKIPEEKKKTDTSIKDINDQIGQPDEYQDSDEGRGIQDTQGVDDGDDLGLVETDQQDLDTMNKNSAKRVDSQFSDMSQKVSEYYQTPDGFTEEDDHFFPFFLTAIIMVVLLYVLYHNKSKVSKVIMGLIVEGRQPGRRRNSRGHAYKRLDTLEQAMSANTAAPPSKIIY